MKQKSGERNQDFLSIHRFFLLFDVDCCASWRRTWELPFLSQRQPPLIGYFFQFLTPLIIVNIISPRIKEALGALYYIFIPPRGAIGGGQQSTIPSWSLFSGELYLNYSSGFFPIYFFYDLVGNNNLAIASRHYHSNNGRQRSKYVSNLASYLLLDGRNSSYERE
ncbi:hypothetical protein Fot_57512 [Forsythia ovata]|uniref:Uncharacterized protein n=1 Tax=Forsythia ovata TaxID=205694 RepID=A0ABD1NV28_9LAMI